MSPPRDCGSDPDCPPHRAKALAENAGKPEDKTHYYPEIVVTVCESDPHTKIIGFTCPGPDTTKVHHVKWKKGTNRGDKNFWPTCPSTLESGALDDDFKDPPATGSEGTLYLSEQYVAAEKADGREIYATRPKWPEELAGKDDFKDLPVTVTSIVVAGVEMRTKHPHAWRFDLMDPKYGAPAQTIAYTAASKRVTLSLTREAFEYFRVPFKASSTDIKRAEQIIGASTVDPTELAWAWNIVAAGERAAEDDPAMPTEDRERIRRLLRR